MTDTKIWRPPFEPIYIPPWVANIRTPSAMSAKDLRRLGIYLGIAGAARGAHAEGDLITQTVDGRDLNDIWAEFQRTLALQNETRQRIVDLLTFPVAFPIEDVPQLATDDFEEASEFGVPKSIRESAGYYSMGYTFKWYDIATRFTWKFLADATAAQVESVHQAVLEADNRLVFSQVMRTIFNNVNGSATIRGQNYNVYKLWNADGVVPPSYKTTVFAGTHSHYLVSIKGTQAVTAIKGVHIDRMYEHLRHHGYSPAQGSVCFLLVNPQEGAQIRLIKAGVTGTPWNRTRLDLLDSVATTDTPGTGDTNVGMYDYIPAVGQPGVLLSGQIAFGVTQPPDTFRGMNVIGAYGPVLIIEEDYIPAGYMLLIASGGQANLQNPVGIREHANTALRGLRLVKGPNPDYPLQESYYQRGFGTGVRQRGVAVVMQNPGSVVAYQIPTAYV